jgi:hypothetical protein
MTHTVFEYRHLTLLIGIWYSYKHNNELLSSTNGGESEQQRGAEKVSYGGESEQQRGAEQVS